MKKKDIFIIIGSIIATAILSLLIVPSFLDKEELFNLPNEVSVKHYEAGTDTLIKEVKVSSKEEIKELSKYVSKLKPLSEHEMVNLALLKEIEIKYNDSISIGVQLGEDSYCYYTNKDENISSLSKMPKGLVDWIKDNLELED
ncbi:MAG: hypothetical protein E7162_03090 [Firmicutes bacterium]|nr:hypothetical protein [Bacillota bacterium]